MKFGSFRQGIVVAVAAPKRSMSKGFQVVNGNLHRWTFWPTAIRPTPLFQR
jgi:hypothetical protein